MASADSEQTGSLELTGPIIKDIHWQQQLETIEDVPMIPKFVRIEMLPGAKEVEQIKSKWKQHINIRNVRKWARCLIWLLLLILAFRVFLNSITIREEATNQSSSKSELSALQTLLETLLRNSKYLPVENPPDRSPVDFPKPTYRMFNKDLIKFERNVNSSERGNNSKTNQ